MNTVRGRSNVYFLSLLVRQRFSVRGYFDLTGDTRQHLETFLLSQFAEEGSASGN